MSEHQLVGVGVGPGDPELLTLKAQRALAEADIILVPSTEASGDEPGRAERIVRAGVPAASERIVRVPFSMADASGVTPRRAEAWRASAQAALDAFDSGARSVVFATIGDPSVYSTFSYLAAHVVGERADVSIDVVPGITAMQALAAASRTPLVEGDEVLALVPLKKGVERLAQLEGVADTVVIYKAGRHFGALREHLAAREVDTVVGIDVGTENQRLTVPEALDEAPYFSTVLATPHRTLTGSRL